MSPVIVVVLVHAVIFASPEISVQYDHHSVVQAHAVSAVSTTSTILFSGEIVPE
jgi:hypothetical protein